MKLGNEELQEEVFSKFN